MKDAVMIVSFIRQNRKIRVKVFPLILYI